MLRCAGYAPSIVEALKAKPPVSQMAAGFADRTVNGAVRARTWIRDDPGRWP